MIEVKVLAESDDNFLSALIGMGLSFNKTTDAMKYGLSIFDGDDYSLLNSLYDQMLSRAKKLAFLGKGHSKFLRAIHLDLIVKAPIDFWEQMATYTTVEAFQSSSTMHSLTSQGIINGLDPHTDSLIVDRYLELLNDENTDFDVLKKSLPCGYMYIRTVHLNYMTLQNIYQQRKDHKLPEWREFCEQIIKQVNHPYFIDKDYESH